MAAPGAFRILRLLADDEFRSGESIARRLGCSRATVNNAIRAAIETGFPVHAVHGRGYRLARPVSWLDGDLLTPALARRGMTLRLVDETASTNADLLAWANDGAPHRAVICAEWQSRGRGRRGREWLAAPGSALMFSMLWRSGHAVAGLAGLPLAVGAMLAAALREFGLTRPGLKWPNDIEVDGAKLAGILIELHGDVLGPSAAIIGVGLNVAGGDTLAARTGRPVTDLRSHLGAVDRNRLLAHLLVALDDGLDRFERDGFAAFRPSWHADHAYQGQRVRLEFPLGEAVAGIAVGVDAQGALLLDTGAGVRAYHSGEISLRPEPA
jgi:BirA family biotin operon repressor/biotin-[acetyl-CoA-carboxylase] ligase